MVIVSASAIPGNEKSVSRVINQLVRTGADVIYEALAEVHVSGHARQEELKLMHMLVRPKFFMPVHGEYRHLYHHARLAEALGMPEDHIHIPEVGEMIELSQGSMNVAGTVPSGSTLIDGLGVGDVGAVVLKDRKHLSEDGLLIVVMGVDHEERAVVSGPDIISRGFVYMREADDLVEGARAAGQAGHRRLWRGGYHRLEPFEEQRARRCAALYLRNAQAQPDDPAHHRGDLNQTGAFFVQEKSRDREERP